MQSLIKVFSLSLLMAVAACGGVRDSVKATPSKPLSVTIAHINDHHSQLDPFIDTELKIDGVSTRVELGGFARVTEAFKRYSGRQDVIKLHAGDATTGTLYYTLFKGEADAAMMNGICFDAMVVGNHEFDDGDAGLGRFLDALRSDTCRTPVLAANITPEHGTPLAPRTRNDYLRSYVLKTVEGVPIAIIGLSTKDKIRNSSRPLASTVIEDEAVAAQKTIDRLKADGVRHFVLLTHLGYEADKVLAAKLTDVDVIVGGDSHSLLGDFSILGMGSSGPYPTMVNNKDGNAVCVAQAWEYGKAIGELNIAFNASGDVERCAGQAALLIGSAFKRKDATDTFVAVDEATRQAIRNTLANIPAVRVTEPDGSAAALLGRYSAQVTARMEETIGTATASLCLIRVPGESTNRSAGVAGCESANTLARGSDIAQVVADAFLAGSLKADVAIQNAGGVRIALPAGPLSMNAAFTLLPFSNVLVELRLSGRELLQALEDAVANHLDGRDATGSHPYAAGLRWDLDMSRPKGMRFSNVQVRDRASGSWSALDPERGYTVVTNDFLASGKDGYAVFGAASARGEASPNYLLYTQTFVDYVLSRKTVARPERSAYSHQRVTTAAGVRLP